MVQCSIKFDNNPNATFLSGSVINGKVEIVLEEPLKVRGVSLIIKGKAEVEWNEEQNDNFQYNAQSSSSSHTVRYTSSETYINTPTILFGSPNGDTLNLITGTHTYHFSCMLPSQLPSSIAGQYGKIHYSSKIIFDCPWKFDKKFKVDLNVLKSTDLNYEHPSIRVPKTFQVSKKFGLWPFESKPLVVEVMLPQTGYISAQNMPVTINLHNESGKTVQNIGVSLKQTINYHSDNPVHKIKTETITVKKLVISSLRNSRKEFLRIDLLVPDIVPTCLESSCRIIQIYYELYIKANMNGPHISPCITIPIIIGNIPLHH